MASKVYLDGVVMSTDRSQADRALISPEIDLEINKSGTFKFTILPTHPDYTYIHLRSSEIRTEGKGNYDWVPVSETVDLYRRKTIVCEGIMTYLNDSLQRPHKYENVTINQFFAAVVSEHNAHTEEKKHFASVCLFSGSTTYTFETNYETTMEVLQKQLVSVFGGYLHVTEQNGVRTLMYEETPVSVNDQGISLRRNLIDLSIENSLIDIATVCIPVGKDGLTVEGFHGTDYVDGSAESISNYGRIERKVEYPDETDRHMLVHFAEVWLSKVQFDNLTIDVSAMDLSDVFGASAGYFGMYIFQKVRVFSRPHGLDKDFVITKVHRDIYAPEKTVITLGYSSDSTLSQKVANMS